MYTACLSGRKQSWSCKYADIKFIVEWQ